MEQEKQHILKQILFDTTFVENGVVSNKHRLVFAFCVKR